MAKIVFGQPGVALPAAIPGSVTLINNAPGFSPIDILAPGAQWLNAAVGVTKVSPPTVTAWTAVLAGTAVWNEAGSGTTYNAAGPNGKPEIGFVLTSALVSAFALVQPFSFMVYGKSSGNSQGFFGDGGVNEFYRSGTPEWIWSGTTNFIHGGTPDNNYHCMIGVINGASSAIYVDGILVASGDGGTGGVGGANNFFIGLGDGTTHLVGPVTDFIFNPAVWTLQQISNLNNWFQQQYNP